MFATQTYRPEIARVAEETVLNLKQLESRIEVLKNDLASLCTVIGHPEAARVAVTPASWLGVTAPYLTGVGPGIDPRFAQGMIGQVDPRFGNLGVPTQAINPWAANQGISPLGSSLTPFASPYAQSFSQGFGQSLSPFPNPYASPYFR